MIVDRKKKEKKNAKEREGENVKFSMRSYRIKGSFSYFWVYLYLVGF